MSRVMGPRAARALALAATLAVLPGLPGAGKAHRVTIESMKYAPDPLELAVGDTVTFVNRDLVPHTVSAGKAIESGTIDADGSWKYVAKRKGEFDYICRFHPGMRARMVVK